MPGDPSGLNLPNPPQMATTGLPSDIAPKILLGLGSILAVVGALLPWVTISVFFASESLAGTNGEFNGKFTLIGGLIAGAASIPLLFMRQKLAWGLAALIMVVGALVGVLALYDMVDIQSTINDTDTGGLASASIGIGLWITVLAAPALVVGSFWGAMVGSSSKQ